MEGRLARWYARQTKNLKDAFASEARDFAARIPPGAHVLELAPGPGYLAVEIAKLGQFEVVGLDISESFVRIARDYAAQSGARVAFLQGDAAAMPFPPEAFDFIVCRAAFKNFADPAGAIAEMHRVLRPGGQAVIRDMRSDASNAALDAAVGAMRLGPIAAMLNRLIFRRLRRRAYSSDELMGMAETSPFGGAEVEKKSDIGFDVALTKVGPASSNIASGATTIITHA
jgi:ubiquinone/menaquinone biosynthesis C-methylase UbiE